MRNHQFTAAQAFTHAHRAAAGAARRGDLAAADKWLRIAERHQKLALNLYKLNDAELDLEVLQAQARAERARLRRAARAAAKDGVS